MKINISRFVVAFCICGIGMLSDTCLAENLAVSEVSLVSNVTVHNGLRDICSPVSTSASPECLLVECGGANLSGFKRFVSCLDPSSEITKLSDLPKYSNNNYAFEGFFANIHNAEGLFEANIEVIDAHGNIIRNSDTTIYYDFLCCVGAKNIVRNFSGDINRYIQSPSAVEAESCSAEDQGTALYGCYNKYDTNGSINWYARWIPINKPNIYLYDGNEEVKYDGNPLALYVGSGAKLFARYSSSDPYVLRTPPEIKLPTRDGYTLEGFYYFTSDDEATEIISAKNCSGNYTGNGCVDTDKLDSILALLDYGGTVKLYARWNECNGTIVNNVCVELGKYFDGTTVSDCPRFYNGATSHTFYKYVQGTSVEGIESCMIQLNTSVSSCGEGTNVVYVYNNREGGFVRKSNYSVEAEATSVVIDEKDQTKYPGNIIKSDNDTATKDYCTRCGTDNGVQQYNVNGVCGYCNGGNCIDSETDTCNACPAGYACPGNEETRQHLYCDHATACKKNQFSETGASACGECALGYSTFYSSPEDGSCLAQSEPNSKGQSYGIKCISAAACKMIPPQLCYKPDCECTATGVDVSETSGVEDRDDCQSSFPLGDFVTYGAVNTKVVQQFDHKFKPKIIAPPRRH